MIRKLARGMHSLGASWMCFALPVLSGCQAAAPHPMKSPQFELWRVDPESSANPPVWFSFLGFYESYAGEFPLVEGELRIGENGTTGWFRVPIMEVTLGEEELDKNVRNNMEMLAGGKYPTSTFTVTDIRQSGIPCCAQTPVTLVGELELKGIRIGVQVGASMSDTRHADKKLRSLSGSFRVDQLRERFGISGPGTDDDPSGNRVRVNFDVTLVRVVEPSAGAEMGGGS